MINRNMLNLVDASKIFITSLNQCHSWKVDKCLFICDASSVQYRFDLFKLIQLILGSSTFGLLWTVNDNINVSTLYIA